MTIRFSDGIGLTAFLAWGLWWAFSPDSVVRFYRGLHGEKPGRLPEPKAIRVLGIAWCAFVLLVFFLGITK